jgi:sulfate transport system substrate-binding protein
LAGALMVYDASRARFDVVLLHASFDPTRELWRVVNQRFAEDHERETGRRVDIRQSHGGSASQARAIIDGLQADVASLGFQVDTDMLARHGMVHDDWDRRLPFGSCPYTSTIVFVVRRGNPKQIRDWDDLIRDDVQVITPNPKTSANGKLSFLAAWGAAVRRGGSDEKAREFVRQMYRRVPVLDTGARGATTTFAQNGIGDVQLTWENEAHLEIREADGGLEVVYPTVSIRAELPVTVIDRVVDSRGTREVAESYLRKLFTPEYQELLAQYDFRPADPNVRARFAARFPEIDLFPITQIAPSWAAAQQRFFALGGEFDQIFQTARP